MQPVPPECRPLVEQLARLDRPTRRAVVSAAEREATQASKRGVVSWKTIDELTGIVSVGGDAVADCERLYDE